MAQDGVLYVEILPSTEGIQKGVEGDLNKAFKGAEKSGTSMFKRLGGLAKLFSATVAGAVGLVTGLAIKGGISRALNIEEAQAKLKGLGQDTATVKAIMDNALASVEGTAFGLGEAATVAASAVAAGIRPGERLQELLTTVANTAAATGTSLEDMGAIFNKVATAGRAYTEDIKRVAERGLPIWQKLAEQLGVTEDEVMKMATQGKISFAMFEQAAKDAAGTVADELGKTTRGAFANMMAALSRSGEILVGGPLPTMAALFTEIRDVINGINNQILKDIFGLSAPDWLDEDRLEAFAGLSERILSVIVPTVQAFKLLATGNFTEDMPWSEDSGIVDFLFNIREMLAPLAELMSAFSPLRAALRLLQPSLAPIGEAFGEIAFALGGALTELLPIIAEAFANIGAALVPLIPPLLELILALVSGLTPVITALGPLIGMVADAFVRLIPALMPIVDAIMQLLPPIFALLAPLIELVQLVLPALIDLFFVIAEPVLALVAVIVDSLMPVIENLVKMFEGVIDFIVGVFTGDWDRAWAGIVAIFEGFGLAVLAGIDAVFKWLKGLVDEIPKFFANAGEWLWNAGKEIINGLWEGMKNIWNDVVKWFENAWNDLVAGWNDFWGIQSPSKLMIEMGHNIGEGFQIGIEDTIPDVSGTLSHMVSIPDVDGISSGGDTYIVNAAPGRTSVQELADLRNRKMALI